MPGDLRDDMMLVQQGDRDWKQALVQRMMVHAVFKPKNAAPEFDADHQPAPAAAFRNSNFGISPQSFANEVAAMFGARTIPRDQSRPTPPVRRHREAARLNVDEWTTGVAAPKLFVNPFLRQHRARRHVSAGSDFASTTCPGARPAHRVRWQEASVRPMPACTSSSMNSAPCLRQSAMAPQIAGRRKVHALALPARPRIPRHRPCATRLRASRDR